MHLQSLNLSDHKIAARLKIERRTMGGNYEGDDDDDDEYRYDSDGEFDEL